MYWQIPIRSITTLALAAAPLLATCTLDETGHGRQQPRQNPVAGIENVWRLNDRLWSGGEPGGMDGLRKIKGLGVRTIVSVDGSAPAVEAARSLGLRYVHVPIGYDGIDPAARLQLVRAFAQLPGPVYVHCHHGKHRGPAAAAVMARAGSGWTSDEAAAYMKIAGTSPDYPGLYEAVRSFRMPTPAELQADAGPLPESVEVPALVELMVKMDERFDRLKAWSAKTGSGRRGGESNAIDPRQEAILLRELTRESARLPECREKPARFRKGFDDLESDLTAWLATIDASDGKSAKADANSKRFEELLKKASARCSGCHRAFRDR